MIDFASVIDFHQHGYNKFSYGGVNIDQVVVFVDSIFLLHFYFNNY